MSTTITRSGDTGQNFRQTVEGETPCSVSVSTNAKGQAQVDVKFYYASPAEAANYAAKDITETIKAIKAALNSEGIPLAGQ